MSMDMKLTNEEVAAIARFLPPSNGDAGWSDLVYLVTRAAAVKAAWAVVDELHVIEQETPERYRKPLTEAILELSNWLGNSGLPRPTTQRTERLCPAYASDTGGYPLRQCTLPLGHTSDHRYQLAAREGNNAKTL